MWQANKVGIIALLVGGAILGIIYSLIHPRDELLAQQIMACGFCILLFSVAMGSWLSVRRDILRCRQAAEEEARKQEEESTHSGGDDAQP